MISIRHQWLFGASFALGFAAPVGVALAEFSLAGYACCYQLQASSMMPTFKLGAWFASVKYFDGALPEAGDVVVFRLPRDRSMLYVKRIVGLPGDKVQMIDGMLHLNGHSVKREQMEDYVDDHGSTGGAKSRVRRWLETLPNGVSFETLDLVERGFLDNTQAYDVPDRNYFVLGDNRDNSADSRVPTQQSGVGYVPLENIVGKVIRPWKRFLPKSGELPNYEYQSG